MSTGLDTFDKTVQESNLWLKDVMERLNTADRHHAYSTLRAVLHALRDRIGPESAAHLGAQLPMLLRGLFYEGWDPTGKPTKERHERSKRAHLRPGKVQARLGLNPAHLAKQLVHQALALLDGGVHAEQ